MKYSLNLTKDEYLGINILNIEEIPECIITPNVLKQKGSLLFEGAAKVGKTDFVFNWMIHMAAGIPFLDMVPARPLKIFYLHAGSVDQIFEKEVQKIGIDQKLLQVIHRNLIVSPSFKMKLNEQGIDLVAEQIITNFNHEVDIIVIDSVKDFYDGDIQDLKDLKDGNDAPLVSFSETRLEALRQQTNPYAAYIVIHESDKKPKEFTDQKSKEIRLNIKGNGKYKLSKGGRYVNRR